MIVLLDSNIWIEYFQGSAKGKKAISFIEGKDKLVVSTINLAEVFGFILQKRTKEDAEQAVSIMLDLAFVVPVDTDIAIQAALYKNEYKWGLADALIYVTALQQKAKVVTGDSDFEGKEEVIFIK